jgi:hypothetical protein
MPPRRSEPGPPMTLANMRHVEAAHAEGTSTATRIAFRSWPSARAWSAPAAASSARMRGRTGASKRSGRVSPGRTVRPT